VLSGSGFASVVQQVTAQRAGQDVQLALSAHAQSMQKIAEQSASDVAELKGIMGGMQRQIVALTNQVSLLSGMQAASVPSAPPVPHPK
jgi:hypothetical protein